MLMSLSVSRWMFLLTLTTVMLSTPSQGYSLGAFIHLDCCYENKNWVKLPVEECYEQLPGWGCPTHAFLVKVWRGWRCINPNSRWLKRKLEAGAFDCPPVIPISKRRFEVLDEDDVE